MKKVAKKPQDELSKKEQFANHEMGKIRNGKFKIQKNQNGASWADEAAGPLTSIEILQIDWTLSENAPDVTFGTTNADTTIYLYHDYSG